MRMFERGGDGGWGEELEVDGEEELEMVRLRLVV